MSTKEKLKAGFLITVTDITGEVEIRPAPVLEFTTYQGLQCYIDIFLPYQYQTIKSVIVSIFHLPSHIRESGYGPKQLPKSFIIEYARDEETGEVVPRHVVLATVEIQMGEASIMYEAVMSPDKIVKIMRYVNRDNPTEVAADADITKDTGVRVLDAIALIGHFIMDQFGRDRAGDNFFAIQEGLAAV